MRKFTFLVSCAVCLVSISCTTEYNMATKRQETLLYGTEKEIKLGDSIAQQIEANYEVNTDLDVNSRVQKILDLIISVCDRKELVYSIKVINKDDLNAVSLPGGYIYVFKGLLDKLESDEQLAGVIAHEVGHITAKHAMKRLQASYGYMLAQLLAIESGNAAVAQGVGAIYTTAFLAYSQQDEFEADRLAVKYTQKAGYNPAAMRDVLELLRSEDQKSIKRIMYFRTHPYYNERIAALNKEITGQLEFKDYLNLTGNEL